MHLTPKFSGLLVLLTTLLSFAHAIPQEDAERRPPAPKCDEPRVKRLVSSFKASSSTDVDPFCSSYLSYTSPLTTVTVTATSFSVITSTVTRGNTVVTVTVTETGRRGKRDVQGRNRVVPRSITTDARGGVSGYPRDVVTAACSCVVTKPTKTSTVTKTDTAVSTSKTTVTVKETRTVTVTTKVSTTKTTTTTTTTKGTSTSTRTSTTTTRSSTTTTRGSATTTTSSSTSRSSTSTTTTSSVSLTTCGSANPTFYIQFQDQNPSRTDVYNNRYLTTEADTYRGVGNGSAVSDVTANKASAELVVYDRATGYIHLYRNPSLVWNVDYFVCLTPIYFDTLALITANEWQPMRCTISGSILNCNVDYPCFGNRKIFETCPEYEEYYYTPLAFGDQVYTAPVCYGKNAVIVPYCTPRAA